MLAAELGARSADHLECATAEDWRALAEAGTVGVLLPAAALTLGQKLPAGGDAAREPAPASRSRPTSIPAPHPPSRCSSARRWRRDCAGSPPRRRCSRSPGTPRSALGEEAEIGHLNPGAWADAVVWECESLEELPYWMPAVRPDCVFMRGADLALPTVERRVWP